MAKGFQKDRARRRQVAGLGKNLVRRAGKKCELCGVSGEPMEVVEVQPAPEIPDESHATLLCAPCRDGVLGGPLEEGRWRFLENAVWSEVAAVQVTAVRLLRRLGDEGAHWPADLLDTVYLSPEVESWLEAPL